MQRTLHVQWNTSSRNLSKWHLRYELNCELFVLLLVPRLLSPQSPSAKDTGLGKTGGGEAVGTILSWKESRVGSGGPKKPPLVLSAPKMSESDADRVEEAVKDFKRVSTYVVRSSLQAAGDLVFFPSLG